VVILNARDCARKKEISEEDMLKKIATALFIAITLNY